MKAAQNEAGEEDIRSVCLDLHKRGPKRKRVSLKNAASLCALRPTAEEGVADVWFLSAYEFFALRRLEEPRYPVTVDEVAFEKYDERFQAVLTASGVQKVDGWDPDDPQPECIPGVDYEVKSKGTDTWKPFPEIAETAAFRHSYVIKRNPRPKRVKFSRCPLPVGDPRAEHAAERNAMLVLAYFHPFTLRAAEATKDVFHPGTA